MSEILDKDIRIRVSVDSSQATANAKTLADHFKQLGTSATGGLNESLKDTAKELSKINLLAKQNAQASKQFYKDEEDQMKRNARLLQSELEQRQKIVDLKSTQASQSNKQYWKDEEDAIKRRSSLLKSWMESQEYSQSKGLNNSSSLVQMASYQSQLSKLNQLASTHWQLWKNTGNEIHKIRFDAVEKAIKNVKGQQESFNDALGIGSKRYYSMGESVQYFLAKTRSHMAWIGSAALLSGIVALPTMFMEAAKEAEAYGAKIKQNLELNEQYANNHEKLAEDIKHLQESAGLFATAYGIKLGEVQQAQQILSRRFKDADTIDYLTNLVATISKLDAVPMEKAASDMEAVILQFGLNAQQTSHFVDEFSVAVHTARITGTELLDALQRSGSVFHQFGADTKTAIAAISALSTTTARTGSTIGNSWKSILSSMEKDKVQKVFDQIGISMYDAQKNMKDFDVLFGELMNKWSSFDQETRNKFARDWAGTYQLNALTSFMNDAFPIYQKLINDMGNANKSLTTKLLSEGLDTYAQKLEKLSASFEVFKVSLGEQALPALKEFTLGLTSGIQWLTKHREELSTLIGYIGKAAEAYVLYRGAMALANVEMAKGVTLGTAIAARFGNIEAQSKLAAAGMNSFGASVWSLTKNFVALAGRMAMFMVMAEAIQRFMGGASAEQSEGDFINEITTKTSGIAGVNPNVSEDERRILNKINGRNDFRNNNANVGAFSYFYMNHNDLQRDNQMTEDIQNDLRKYKLGKEIDAFQNKYGNLMDRVKIGEYPGAGTGGTNLDFGGNKGSSGTGSTTNPSFQLENKLQKMQTNLEVNTLYAQIKKSADDYKTSLELLDDQEKIYGTTATSVAQRLQLMTNRRNQLNEEAQKSNDLAWEYNEKAEQQIYANSDVIDSILKVTKVNSDGFTQEQKIDEARKQWSKLDKQTKKEILDEMKVALGETSEAYYLFEKALDLVEKRNEKWNEAKRIGSDIDLSGLQSPQKVLSEQNTMAGYRDTIAKNSIGRFDPFDDLKKNVIELESVEAQIKRTKEAMAKMAKQIRDAGGNPETIAAYRQLQAELSNLEVKAEELRDKYYDVRKAWADATVDMVLEGKSFGDIMKQMWRDLAKEAIYQMFRIKQTQSTLSAMSGKGKGKGGVGATQGLNATGTESTWFSTNAFGSTSLASPSYTYGGSGSTYFPTSVGFAAEGGVKDGWTVVGEKGPELVNFSNPSRVYTAKDTQSMLSQQKNDFIPTYKDAEVKQMVSQSSNVGFELKQSQAHIAELERQTELMQNMLQTMINSNGNNGGVMILQTQVSSSDINDVLQRDPSIVMNAFYKAQGQGYR